jgi:membrane-associated phospholipid phosphatase
MAGLTFRVLGSLVVVCTAAPLWAQTDVPTPFPENALVAGPHAPAAEPDVTSAVDFAQIIQQPAGPPPTPRHTGIKAILRGVVTDVRHLPSRENLFWLGVGSGLALAAHPFDDDVNQALVGSDTAETIFKPGEILGELGTLLGTASTVYAVGRLKDQPRVSHVGMDLIRSLILSEGVTQTIKHVAWRERPDGSSHTSFPSGHAADTFAFATALERHVGWRYSIPAYAFSSYVAISRLPANRHWLSDAVFGASVGIIAGRTVTRPAKGPGPVTVTFIPGGAAITFVSRNGR